jgi:beta-lactam-binding protein with PASTA domain
VSRGPDRQQEQPTRTPDDGQAPSREARVPDLTGMTPTLARIALVAARLVPGSVDSADAPGVRAGRVVGQRPAAGTVVPVGTRVQLTLARRAPVPAPQPPSPDPPAPDPPSPPARTLVAVPDLSGRSVAEARRITGGARLLLGEVDSVAAPGAPGAVVRQRPAAGDSVQPGSFVSITVSRQALVTVPRLAGRTPSQARRELIGAGLRPGSLTEREAPGPTSVVRQSVPAGSRVAAGTTVDLVISVAPVTPPAPPPPPPVERPDTPAVQVTPPPPPPPAADSLPAAQAESVAPLPAVAPATPPAVAPPVAPPVAEADTQTAPGASGPAFRWEWLAALALLLLVIAATLLLRSRAPRGAPRAATPVVPSPIVPTIAVRSRSGETSTSSGTGAPVGGGRVKIGMIAGAAVAPEPEPGAAALGPARLVVRLADTDVGETMEAPPARVMGGAQVRVQAGDDAPVLERDEGAVILKRR